MSDTDSKPLVPIWTPDDYRKTRDDVARLTDQDEFDADMAYLWGLSGALFEHGSPADLMRIAAFDSAKS